MKRTLSDTGHGISRRTFLTTAAAAAVFAGIPRGMREAFAAQPMAGKPRTLGVSRTGSATVIPFFDGPCGFPLSVFKGADEAAMLKTAGVQPIPGAYNVFLIERGTERFLVDAGIGTTNPGKSGQLPQCLAAARTAAPDIGKIFITHMHLDHIGGLVNDGKLAFPGAQVYIARAEYDYWMGDEAMRQAPENRRGRFQRTREFMRILEKNRQNIAFFKPGDVLAPDVRGVDLAGHTPGHAGIQLTCGSDAMLFIGDLVHGAALQMPRPDITTDFDVDPAKAIQKRREVFDRLGRNDLVAGAHLPFPGMGFVRPAGQGKSGYTFTALDA